MQVLIGTLSSLAGDYPKLMKSQQETWGQLRPDIKKIWYYGDGDSFDGTNLQLPVGDDLHVHSEKTIKFFQYILKHFQFDVLFRTNASSYICQDKMMKWLEKNYHDKFYAGVVGQDLWLKFCSGSGFFLSRDLVELCAQMPAVHGAVDDVHVGIQIHKHHGFIMHEKNERYGIFDREFVMNGNVTIENKLPNVFHYRCLQSYHNRHKDVEAFKYLYDLETNGSMNTDNEFLFPSEEYLHKFRIQNL